MSGLRVKVKAGTHADMGKSGHRLTPRREMEHTLFEKKKYMLKHTQGESSTRGKQGSEMLGDWTLRNNSLQWGYQRDWLNRLDNYRDSRKSEWQQGRGCSADGGTESSRTISGLGGIDFQVQIFIHIKW